MKYLVLGIAGASLGAALALAGFLIAGTPGMLVGLLLSFPLGILFGMYFGSHS